MKKRVYQITGIVLVLVLLIGASSCHRQESPSTTNTTVATTAATTPSKVPIMIITQQNSDKLVFSAEGSEAWTWGPGSIPFVDKQEPLVHLPGPPLREPMFCDFIATFFETPLELYDIASEDVQNITILYDYVLTDFERTVYFTSDGALLVKDIWNNRFFVSKDGIFTQDLTNKVFEGCYVPY